MADGGRAALLAALDVRGYARHSLAVGLAVGVGLPLLFVGPLGIETRYSLGWYAGLAFATFVATAIVTETVLVARRALRLAATPAGLVRRGGAAAMLGAGCWVVGGLLVLTPAWRWAGVVLPWGPVLTVGGVWALHTRYKRTTPYRPLGAVGAVVGAAGALVVADLTAVDLAALGGLTYAPSALWAVMLAGVWALALGHATQAVVAVRGGAAGPEVAPVALVPAGAALAPSVFGRGLFAVAMVALAMGLAWLPVAATLRTARAEDVPAGPDPLADSVGGQG